MVSNSQQTTYGYMAIWPMFCEDTKITSPPWGSLAAVFKVRVASLLDVLRCNLVNLGWRMDGNEIAKDILTWAATMFRAITGGDRAVAWFGSASGAPGSR